LGTTPGSVARTVSVALLSAAVAPLGPGVRVPEAMQEVRNMLQTRVAQWIEQWKQEGRLEGEQQGQRRGEQKGRRQGEAAFLLRLLERRFGVLPGWAAARVRAADSVMLGEWGLRVLDAANLVQALAER
jgi:hypothetical protein